MVTVWLVIPVFRERRVILLSSEIIRDTQWSDVIGWERQRGGESYCENNDGENESSEQHVAPVPSMGASSGLVGLPE